MPVRWPVNPLGGKPPTGEPDAGKPHVRFGGRGGATQCAFPTPIERAWVSCLKQEATQTPVIPAKAGIQLTPEPEPRMLTGLDALVVGLQDVGARYFKERRGGTR